MYIHMVYTRTIKVIIPSQEDFCERPMPLHITILIYSCTFTLQTNWQPILSLTTCTKVLPPTSLQPN